MRAWMLDGPGGPEAFRLVEREVPALQPGWVLIAVEGFGLNRSELFSRKGMSSPDFSFPRVLGLECAGRIADGNGTDLAAGQRVVALMGGMGRGYDGGYASYAAVPRAQVFVAPDALAANKLAAIPETYNTAVGVCLESLALDGSETVLIRGGTSALGMAAAEIAKHLGCTVVATSRKPHKAELLAERSRIDHVLVDGDDLPQRVLAAVGPVQAVVECVGSKQTIESSCAAMPEGGRLGRVGELAESWNRDDAPDIPDNITSTFTRSDLIAAPKDDARMAQLFEHVVAGHYAANIHQAYPFEQLPEAHRAMEQNLAVGKLVVLVEP